jgi:hypothetical protein
MPVNTARRVVKELGCLATTWRGNCGSTKEQRHEHSHGSGVRQRSDGVRDAGEAREDAEGLSHRSRGRGRRDERSQREVFQTSLSKDDEHALRAVLETGLPA